MKIRLILDLLDHHRPISFDTTQFHSHQPIQLSRALPQIPTTDNEIDQALCAPEDLFAPAARAAQSRQNARQKRTRRRKPSLNCGGMQHARTQLSGVYTYLRECTNNVRAGTHQIAMIARARAIFFREGDARRNVPTSGSFRGGYLSFFLSLRAKPGSSSSSFSSPESCSQPASLPLFRSRLSRKR